MSLIRKLAGQTAIYGLSSMVGRLLFWFLTPLYTNKFLPAEYGVVTQFYAYAAFLMIIFTYGMETTFFRFSESEMDKGKVFSTAFISLCITSLALAGIFFLLAPVLGTTMVFQGQEVYIKWFALILALDALSYIPFAKLRSAQRPLKFAVLKLFSILVNIVLNLFFLLYCPYVLKHPDSLMYPFVNLIFSPTLGVGYIFLSGLLASGITLLTLIPEMRDIRFGFDKELWRRMILYSLPLLVVGLAGMVNETLDRIMLGWLLTDKATMMEQIGIYGACYKLSILMTLFIQMFRYAAEPFFFAQSSKENAKQIYADVMKYFVITCAFIFLGVMLYMDIVKYFIGANYYSGLKVVPVLLLANLCLGVFVNLSMWYKLTGKTRLGAYVAVFGALVTIGLNFWWIPLFGYEGSAWATLVCYASMMVVSYFMGQKYFPVPYPVVRILSYLGLAILIYFISVWIKTALNPVMVMVMGINTMLILAFASVVYFLEKRKKSVT